jgi:hypothetical protein
LIWNKGAPTSSKAVRMSAFKGNSEVPFQGRQDRF